MIAAWARPVFIANLLGQPYERSGRHCWWLAGLIQREVFGREVPTGPETLPANKERARLFREHPARGEWQQHSEPTDGDLVLMGKVPDQDIHCGVYLADLRGVIHTDRGHGVVIDSITEMQAVHGWHLSFYRPI